MTRKNYVRLNGEPRFVEQRPWTEEERRWALRRFGRMTSVEIGKALGRSKCSVLGMIHRERQKRLKAAAERARLYREANRDKTNAASARWRKENAPHMARLNGEWSKQNRERKNLLNRQSRARKRQQEETACPLANE